jgi:hypothetical protein
MQTTFGFNKYPDTAFLSVPVLYLICSRIKAVVFRHHHFYKMAGNLRYTKA